MCGRAQTHSSRPAWVTEGPALSSSGSDIPPPGDRPAPLNDSRSVFNFTFREHLPPGETREEDPPKYMVLPPRPHPWDESH